MSGTCPIRIVLSWSAFPFLMKYRGRCLSGNRQNPSGRRQMAGPGFHKTYYNKNNGNPASGMSLFFYNVFCNFLVTVQTALCDFLYYLLKLRRSKMAFRSASGRKAILLLQSLSQFKNTARAFAPGPTCTPITDPTATVFLYPDPRRPFTKRAKSSRHSFFPVKPRL